MSDPESLTQRYANLSQAKRLLLEKRLGMKYEKEAPRETRIIPRLTEREALQLSPGQQRLWFLDQLEPGNPVYNEFVALRLVGQLEIELLERSLNEIARRHETLRTAIREIEGKPVQIIQPAQPFRLKQVDLRDYEAQERTHMVEQLGIREARTPFVLAQGPLWRVMLLLLGTQEHVLFLTVHHIIFDGWSGAVFMKELCTHYQNYQTEGTSSLPDLPIQYADYAAWQRSSLQGEIVEQQLTYWKKQLEGMPALLELPTDHLRPAVQTFNGFTYPFEFPRDLFQKLQALSLREGVTLYMVLLAGFQLLLSRYSGQENIVVGSPIAERNNKETEDLIGFFINSLVLRTDLSGNPRFLDLLQRVRRTALEAYTHQDIPFEMLVDMLQPDRKLSHNPLVQVMFVLYNSARPTLEFKLPHLTVTQMDEIERGTSKFDLSIFMWQTKESIGGLLEGSSEIFSLSTLQRFICNFQTLLESIVAAPETSIADLPLLSQQERQEILYNWNQTERALPDLPLAQLFEQQASRYPMKPALVEGERVLSYAQLNEQANRLGWWLRAQGVGPEVLVGVCLTRSCELLVLLLAIVKAGGAYVPLDPDYPRERLAMMLEDGQVELVLTDREHREALPTMAGRQVCLEEIAQQVNLQPCENLPARASQQNLAYIIYTSGSTGRPKGVQVCQRSIVRLLFGVEYVQLDNQQTLLHLAPISFDAATFEVWGALLHGGICVLSRERLLTAEELGEQLEHYGVTTLWLTASLYNALIEQRAEALAGVRQLLIGGEALSVHHVRRGQERMPRTQIINGYGPTEGTTFTCCYPIPRPIPQEWATIPLGGPLGNTRVYVLDQRGEPVGIGIEGELYIGGEGLARGYAGRADLTAERFVPALIGMGERWYRTGDIVKWREDGVLEYVGRRDEQVKIRGYRIELGEIETVLRQDADVQDAVVQARENEAGSKQLVAYVVPRPGHEVIVEQLRDSLQKKLPAYMVPSAILLLATLPLTANDKIDFAALPGFSPVSQASNEEDLRSELNAVEHALIGIWREILGLTHIGVHDNFFELGGDSILSIQVVARARQHGIYLTPRLLFQQQTIAELATMVETTPGWEAEQGTVTGEIPLTPIQHWFFEQDLPDPHHWNQAFLLEMPWKVQANHLQAALAHIVKQHDALRLRFSQEGDGWKQQIVASEDGNIFSYFDLSALSADEQKRVFIQEATRLQESLDLQKGPLLHAGLFALNKEHFRLLLVIHHLAVDGVSWRILLEDLQSLYQQIAQEKKVQFAPKTTSFKQWSHLLQEYAHSSEIRQEATGWLSQLQNAESKLPVDLASGENTFASMNEVTVTLSIEETQSLLQELARVYRANPFELLLTALSQVLTNWIGESSLLIDVEGHGREEIQEEIDLSRTVGWFTSMYPLYLTVNRNDLSKTLAALKTQLHALPYKGLGYGVLRYLSTDPEIVARYKALPEARVGFNYLGQFDQAISEKTFWTIGHEHIGASHSLKGQRRHALNIEASIIDKQLHIMWLYSENVHQRSTIMQLAQKHREVIRELIAHQHVPLASNYTPADFPDEDLSQEELAAILQQLSRN